MDINLFSWFKTEYLIIALTVLSVLGLILEFLDQYGSSERAVLISILSFVAGYFALKHFDFNLSISLYIASLVVIPTVYFLIKTWRSLRNATKKIVNYQQASIFAKIERNFDRYAGFAPRKNREEYIKTVVNFLRGKEIITWEQLVNETSAVFADTLKMKNTHNNICYTPEGLTATFVSDILTLLMTEVNYDSADFIEIQPIWEIRNAQRDRTFSQLIQRPHVPWLEINVDMGMFYALTLEFIFTWPAKAVKAIRQAFESGIKATFKLSLKKQINYLS